MYVSLRVLPLFLLSCLTFFGRRSTYAINVSNVTVSPGRVEELVMKTNTSIRVTGCVYLTQQELNLRPILCSQVTDPNVARPLPHVCNNQSLEFESISSSADNPCSTDITDPANPAGDLYFFNGSFHLYGVLLGRTEVKISMKVEGDPTGKGPHEAVLIEKYLISVIRKPRILDHIFTGTIILFVIFINVGFGCMIDLKVIKEIMKKPVVPILGLCCQYIINPLMAYGLLKALKLDSAFAFGMFAFGCSPSGSASNAWAVILKGDIDLSLFVTFASTVAALGMMPLWLFTLGKTIVDETIRIPYKNIMMSLVSLIVPVLIGILIHRCLPKVAKFLVRLVKPASGLFLLYVCTFGLYVNAFMFQLLTWKVFIAGITMPFCTFTLGFLVATLCRLPYKRVITIAIETAIQNTGIALVMMLATLPKPDGDIAAVMPVAGSVFTPLPLVVALIGSCIYGKCTGANKDHTFTSDGKVNSMKIMHQNNNSMSTSPS